MKRLQNFHPATRTLSVLLGVAAVLLVPMTASASTQNFNVLNSQVQLGMLVSSTNNTGVAEPSTDSNASALLGVAVTANDLDFANQAQAGQITVQTDGQANALVSTVNGDIKVGDRITAASIVGVGAKATKSSWIVGIAQGSLDKATAGATTSVVTDSTGATHTVYVASIPMIVKVTYYTQPTASTQTKAQTKKDTPVPDGVQSLADKVAGKHVSSSVVILSAVLCLAGVIVAGMVVTSAVRSGFLAISRQPLAKKIILRRIAQSFGLALLLLTFVVASAAVLVKVL